MNTYIGKLVSVVFCGYYDLRMSQFRMSEMSLRVLFNQYFMVCIPYYFGMSFSFFKLFKHMILY